MRKLPIALVFASGVIIELMAAVSGRSLILLGLREFSFTIFSFLVLMAVFNDLTLGEASSIRKILGKIKAFLTEEEIYFGVKTGEFFERIKARMAEIFSPDKTHGDESKQETKESVSYAETPDLVQIQKDRIADQKDAGPLKNKSRSLSALYIVFFMGITFWRISRLFAVVPREHYGQGIPHALLLLFLYCVTVIYLKMRKGQPEVKGDKSSYGMLTLFAYVSLVYAAVMGINSVLNIDILGVLQWVYYAATVYLIAALALNILLSVFKNDVLGNFNYTIIPERLKAGDGSFLDSEEVKVNFSLKSLYTFKYTLKILPALILSLGFILFLSTSVFIVQPHQQAAVYRLGRFERTGGEGLHLKLPWPIDIVEIYDVYRVNSLQIGYESFSDTMNFLWDRIHDRSEYLLLLGNGNELVSVNMKIVYYVSDLYSYMTTSADPEAILSAAALEALMNRTANTTMDTFLSVDRDLLSASILEELSAFCKNEELGLSVIQVIIESIHPPVDIAYVYQRVVSASVDKQTFITQALSDAEEMRIDAERESNVARVNAIAGQYNRVSSAQREMAVYYAAMEAYEINPGSFRLSKYLNTFETVISGNRVFVFSPGTENSISASFAGRAGGALLDFQTRRQYNE